MRGKLQDRELPGKRTFADAAKKFEAEFEVQTEAERHVRWVKYHLRSIALHLNPFFWKMAFSAMNAATAQKILISRRAKDQDGNKKTLSCVLYTTKQSR